MIEINISPVAFTIAGFGIRWYGIFLALGVTEVLLWTLWHVRKSTRVSYETVLNAALVGIPSGIVFSRLLHVLDEWDYYSQYPSLIIGGDGLTIYGAVLGAALGIWVFSRFSKVSFGYLADIIAPGILLGQALGRVGCLLNGCCYGVECNLAWSVMYSNPETFAPIGVPVHPTQIYEIIFLLIAFVILMFLRGRFRPDGSLFVIYLGIYSIWRFGIGFLREGRAFFFDMQQAQVVALAVVALTVYWIAFRSRWVGTKPEDEEILPPPPPPLPPEASNSGEKTSR
ncbi:MAG: prolipoprotein diacylglyceryl transferase [Dehalococcoidales bacterium]|nr:prolipoprotein diacylglyceryl transferase [Dehalococcoidales bacterium]